MTQSHELASLRLRALRTAKMHLKTARDSCRLAGAKRTLLKLRSALKSVDGAIRHAKAKENRSCSDDWPQRARGFVSPYPVPDGDPPAEACGGREEEPVDGWCLIEVWDGLFEIQADGGCGLEEIADDEAALRYVLERAQRTAAQRYIDALRWHVRDAGAIREIRLQADEASTVANLPPSHEKSQQTPFELERHRSSCQR